MLLYLNLLINEVFCKSSEDGFNDIELFLLCDKFKPEPSLAELFIAWELRGPLDGLKLDRLFEVFLTLEFLVSGGS